MNADASLATIGISNGIKQWHQAMATLACSRRN
jgi:hypothetical protein